MASIFNQNQIETIKGKFVTYANDMLEYIAAMNKDVDSLNSNWGGTGKDYMVTKGNDLLGALKNAQVGIDNIKKKLGIKSDDASALAGNLG